MNRAARRQAARRAARNQGKDAEQAVLHITLAVLLDKQTPNEKALRLIGEKFSVTMLYISAECPGCGVDIPNSRGVMIGRCPTQDGCILHAQCKNCAALLLSGDTAPAHRAGIRLSYVVATDIAGPGQVMQA